MGFALYLHPFDLEALERTGGLPRLADLGVRELVLAVAYHDGRWLMPWHPAGRVRFLEDGCVHYRPAARYGRLQPQPSTAVPPAGPSPLERLCAAAPGAGLRVRAWWVGNHNSRLGELHPDCAVENAAGDRYAYALCPAQPEVQQYLLAMAADLAGHPGLGAIEAEALGWMGYRHSSHHDKSSFAPRGLLDYALSACFCAACRQALAAAGHDPEALRQLAREALALGLEQACALEPAVVLPERFAAGLLPLRSVRRAVLAEFGARLAQVLRGGPALALQVHPDPWFTGSQLPQEQAALVPAVQHVVTAYGENPAAIQGLLDGLAKAPVPGRSLRLSLWPKAPQCTGEEDLVKVRELARARGVGEFALYHLGLLPWRTLERVAKVIGA
jgi:hypothetical protein